MTDVGSVDRNETCAIAPLPTVRASRGVAVVRRRRGLARLGAWCAADLRTVVLLWLIVLALFAPLVPKVGGALAGAGWQDSGSESVHARALVEEHFAGLGSTALQVVVHDSSGAIADDPAAHDVVIAVRELLEEDPRVSVVVPAEEAGTVSPDGRTVVIEAGAAGDANDMVRAADELLDPLHALATGSVSVELTGASGLWADFNRVNTAAMFRSEVLSWPVTLLVLVLAFGSLVAAGLPLMLTLVGLVTAAGALVVTTHVAPVSVWALNFALMFALALGVDYALFVVVRFRAALKRRSARPGDRAAAIDAVAEAMATAGKAVVFSAVTILVCLSTVLLVPSPAFRSMALGIMLAVVAVLAATLTLLPAVLGELGTRIDAGRLRRPHTSAAHKGRHRRSTPPRRPVRVHAWPGLTGVLDRWGAFVSARPWHAGAVALGVLLLLAGPLIGMRTGMPSIAVVPPGESSRIGHQQVVDAFGAGAPGTLQVLVPDARAVAATQVLQEDPGLVGGRAVGRSGGWALLLVTPATDPSSTATGDTVDRLRATLPAGSLVGGAAAENHDLETVLAARTPVVFTLLLALGFVLLLLVLGSPLVALVASTGNLLSIAAAFGVGRFVFQSGNLSGLLDFEPQGFVDAWGPLFFGAMLTGVAMDYTLFLMSTAREHFDRTGDAQLAMRLALRTSGRVVVAAAGVVVAVFLTFALSGPLAPKEMGVLLAVAVFLDALCIRLVVLPALLRVSGPLAWWMPERLARIVPRVRFGH